MHSHPVPRHYTGCLIAAALIVSMPLQSHAAFDAFLKLGDIQGESTDDKHKNEIDVLSLSWKITQPLNASAGGAVTGKAVFSDIIVTKQVDKSSPLLYLHCASGKHIPSASFVLRKPGSETALEYLKITLQDVIISSVQSAAATDGDSLPTEIITLNFGSIQWEYVPQKRDGSTEAPVRTGWDIKENKGL